jgi:amidase
VPIAHANDGGGSIRIPAAMCGVIGLKPSRGRLIPQPKAKAMPINIVSDGVITRSMRDQANFYFEAEKFFSPPNLQPIGSVEGPGKRRLRIGFLFDSYFAKACPETRRAVETTVAKLAAAGHEVEETRMPVDQRFADDFTHYWSFMAFSIEYMGWMFFGRGEAGFDRAKLDGLTKGLSRNFRQHFFRNLGAIRRLRAAESRLKQELWRFDAVVSPVVAKVTPELGYFNATIEFGELLRRLQEYVGYTPMENVLGNPAIALPMGQSDRGDPIGVQISAPTGEERRLLELGFELEAASSWKWLFQ